MVPLTSSDEGFSLLKGIVIEFRRLPELATALTTPHVTGAGRGAKRCGSLVKDPER